MPPSGYLMESDEEALRLDLKTDPEILMQQARWAGIAPGMRVADIGCGPGKTTFSLNRLVRPDGETVGFDLSADRIDYARTHFSSGGIRYVCRDILDPMDDMEPFDFIWVRFFLEYKGAESAGIVRRLQEMLRPGGILCLIDLDMNCLCHFGIPQRLEEAIAGAMAELEKNTGFDSRMGIKLYSFLYDLGFEAIDVTLGAHHLIYGDLGSTDAYNWRRKVEVAARRSGYRFPEYADGYDGFYNEFEAAFADPRRFTYTPVICCRGQKPGPK